MSDKIRVLLVDDHALFRGGVKALLQRIGIGQGLRLPLLPLSAPHHAHADHLAADVGALEELSSR